MDNTFKIVLLQSLLLSIEEALSNYIISHRTCTTKADLETQEMNCALGIYCLKSEEICRGENRRLFKNNN